MVFLHNINIRQLPKPVLSPFITNSQDVCVQFAYFLISLRSYITATLTVQVDDGTGWSTQWTGQSVVQYNSWKHAQFTMPAGPNSRNQISFSANATSNVTNYIEYVELAVDDIKTTPGACQPTAGMWTKVMLNGCLLFLYPPDAVVSRTAGF